jgi:hypothetical protein
MEAKILCRFCQNPIAFSVEDSGSSAPCPHCGEVVTLTIPAGFHKSKPLPPIPQIESPKPAPTLSHPKPSAAKQIRDRAEIISGIGIMAAVAGGVTVLITGFVWLGITSKSS